MAWTNLNDVYVSTNGGTIAGDLKVNGTLTINDKKGTNTTYDVASQITSLRDSVSHKANTGVYFPSSITSGRQFENCTTRYGNIIFITISCNVNVWSSWEKWNIGTAPKPIGNTWAHGMAFYQTGSVAPVPMDAYVTDSGLIYVQNKSGLSLGDGWLFVNIVYACV